MAWIMDTYSMKMGYSVPAVVTGKPVAIGGSLGRREATGRGCVYILEETLARLEGKAKINRSDFAEVSVAIQGFGNVGAAIANLLFKKGFKVVAVSDSQGAVYHPKGINIRELLEHKRETGSVVEFRKAEEIPADQVLEAQCDVLIPAALASAIREDNADGIRAKIIIEAANAPITPEAAENLEKKGIFVVPDILANGGGVVVSYFEWVQNLESLYWEEKDINQRLKRTMVRTFREVLRLSLRKRVSMRIAAYMIGIQKIAEAVKVRGLYP
jgi:glutamate dehydrogenase (NAD(P)+)